MSGLPSTANCSTPPTARYSGVRHAWTFDDMFSTYALQGLETKTQRRLQPRGTGAAGADQCRIAEGVGFFTFAKADGKKRNSSSRSITTLNTKDGTLTLAFHLDAEDPGEVPELVLDVFDPEFFIDFKFADKNPAGWSGPPAACQMTFQRPSTAPRTRRKLGEQNSPAATIRTFGAMFANKITVDAREV